MACVLLVSRDPDEALLLAQELRRFVPDLQYAWAEDAPTVGELVQTMCPDLVLFDCVGLELGVAVLGQLRSRGIQAPVVCLGQAASPDGELLELQPGVYHHELAEGLTEPALMQSLQRGRLDLAGEVEVAALPQGLIERRSGRWRTASRNMLSLLECQAAKDIAPAFTHPSWGSACDLSIEALAQQPRCVSLALPAYAPVRPRLYIVPVIDLDGTTPSLLVRLHTPNHWSVALPANLAALRLVLDAVPEPAALFGLGGDVLHLNANAPRWDAFPDEAAALAQAAEARVTLSPDGRWCQVPWFDEQGRPAGVILHAHEGAESSRALRALRRARVELESRRSVLRAMVDAMEDLIWFERFDGGHDCNRAFAEFVGLSPAQIDQLPPRRLLSAQPQLRPFFEVAPGAESSSLRLRTAGGELGRFEVSAHLVRRNGNALGVLRVARDVSRHEALMRRLAEREQQLEFALTASGIGVLRLGQKHAQLDERAATLLAMPGPGSYPLLKLLRAVPRADRRRLVGAVRHAVQRGGRLQCDFRVLSGERLRYLSGQGRRIETGGISSVMATLLDVSARERQAQAVARSRDRLDMALQNGEMGIVEWSAAEGLQLSSQARNLFALPAGRRVSLDRLLLRVHSRHRRKTVAALRRAADSGRLYQLTVELDLPRRQDRPIVELRGRVLHRHGQLTASGVVVDVSSRVGLERALARSQERLDLAVVSADLAAWTWDVERDEVNWSVAQSEMLGLAGVTPPVSLDNFLQPILPADRGTYRRELERSVQGGGDFSARYRLCDADGTVRTIESRGRAIEHGGEVIIAGIDRDVTAQLAREAELRAARDAAQKAAQAKTRFLANMSHEIRTPINAVLGFAQLLIRSELESRQRDYAETILHSGTHLLGLVNDVLELSKIEAGSIEIHRRTFDLLRLLRDLEAMFAIKGEDTPDVSFAARLGELPRMVSADEGKLRQILINLLSNAFKFTRRGEIALQVAVDSEGETPWLVARVRDTGPGIAEDEIEGIFGEFTQGGNAAELDGAGLGLAISRRYARFMGGELSVQSELGKGSTFTLRVPIEAVAAEPVHCADARSVRLHGDAQPLALVVDDNLANRELLTAWLDTFGFRSVEAEDGASAMRALRREPPELVLMDIHMPGLNGYQATSRIRSTQDLAKVPIIAITASVFEGARQMAEGAGADYFLRKPFTGEELVEALTACGFEFEEIETPPPTRDDFSASHKARSLSDTLVAAVTTAAEKADFAELQQLMVQVEACDQVLAESLRGAIGRLAYDEVIQMVSAQQ